MRRDVARRLRVLLADDHDVVLQGLERLLAGADVAVVGLARNGREAVRLAARLHPDVALIDIVMPLQDGFWATRAILRASPRTKVLLLSGAYEDRHLAEAWRVGAMGLALKSQPIAELVRAVREVAQGKIYLCPSVGDATPPPPAAPSTTETLLSPRERQVLQLVTEGFRLKGIARQLGISAKTAEHHLEHLRHRLGIDSTAGLVRYAIRSGLVGL